MPDRPTEEPVVDHAVDVKTILVVAAHPDDIDFGAAGSVAAWTDKGIEVRYCIVTDGDAGGFDPDVPRSEIPRIRREEQTKAAKTVGVSELHFLGYPDGRLEVTIDLRRDISRVIRQVRPDRMLCPSPERNIDAHLREPSRPSRRGRGERLRGVPRRAEPVGAPGAAAGRRAGAARRARALAHGLATVPTASSTPPRRSIARSPRLLCHESQMPDPGRIPKLITEWGATIAATAGLPHGSYAEGFQRIETA